MVEAFRHTMVEAFRQIHTSLNKIYVGYIESRVLCLNNKLVHGSTDSSGFPSYSSPISLIL
jgi:hypothetical protein